MFSSIIIPVYNVENYLSQCVDSILSQTFDDFELILVDDGSTDSSPIICDNYSKKDNRVKVIHKSNSGAADSRNVGLLQAKGDYIIYLDSDDFLTCTTFLEDVYNRAKETNSDIILYKFSKFYESSKTLDECSFSLSFLNKIENSDDFLCELVKRDAYYGMAWIKAFRRVIATENNILFDTSLICEDMDWYFALVLCANSFAVIDKSYIAYRQREGSVTSTVKLKNLNDYIYTLEKWNKIITEKELSPAKRQALMGALAKYYSNMLITFIRVTDRKKKDSVKRIKALSHLLDYGMSSRPQTFKKLYNLIGFSGVTALLKIYDKNKRS